MNGRSGVVLLGSLLMGCGDYTSPDAGSGGASSAGSAQGGSGAGAAGDGGKAQAGQAGQGGAIVGGLGGGGSGGLAGSGTGGSGGVVDPRCPARQPMGACSEPADLACEYDTRGCLCYEGYGLCMRVDPNCTSFPPTPPAEPGGGGSGGFSTKIPVQPRVGCNCVAGRWLCSI